MGMGPVEAMVVMEELGRGIVAGAARGRRAGRRAACSAATPRRRCKPHWLPRIAGGEALVVLAHQERKARYRLDRVRHAGQAGRRRLDV